MSGARAEQVGLLNKCEEFLRRYYSDEIGVLAQNFPNDQKSLYVDWGDLHRYDRELADDYLKDPEQIGEYLEEALRLYDLPIDVDLSDAHVRVTNLHANEEEGVGDVYDVAELGEPDLAMRYVGVRGQISRTVAYKSKMEETAFECQRCGTLTYIPQSGGDYQEPHECQGCERQGPFQINFGQSEYVGYRKIQLQQPPEKTANGSGPTITVHLKDDLAKIGGPHELEHRVGEEIVAYGIVRLEQQGSGQNKSAVFEPYLQGEAIDFDSEIEEIDVEDHREEFEPLAKGAAPVESFKDCMAPELKRVDNWPLAFDLGAAWLFGSPRLNPAEGSTHRGDIHWAMFGPPGVGKSVFMSSLADLSPGVEHSSAPGVSDVGLVAATVRDDFADGDNWTLKPGILARAESHVILDEIDKAELDLSKANNALDEEQRATVDKADIHAELNTRVGCLFAGNPEGGRWADLSQVSVKEQVDVRESLWSRFDGVVVLQDDPDEETDREVGDHMLNQYRADEARALEDSSYSIPEHVSDAFIRMPEEIERPIPKDAVRAWVMAGRQIDPVITDEVHDALLEAFVDLRNPSGASETGFVATKRELMGLIRASKAYARVRLSHVVEEQDAKKAVSLHKRLKGQLFDSQNGFDGDQFTEATSKTQQNRLETMLQLVAENTNGNGADRDGVIAEAQEELNISYRRADKDIDKLLREGQVREPETDVLRVN